MNIRTKLFVLAASAVSLVGVSSPSASARIVCNEWTVTAGTRSRPTPTRQASSLRSILTAGAGKKASITRGKSTRVAVTGTAANGKDFLN